MRGLRSRITLALHPGYGAIVAALLVVFSFPAFAQQRRAADAPVKITVVARAIDAFKAGQSDQVQFGALEFRGGLELTSSYREFGGLSAIRVAADGARFVALTDKGRWLTGRITYDARERPSGIADAVMAPMLGPDGRTLASRGWFDTESIAEDGGTLYVGIERVNRIVRFDFGRDGVLARATPIPTPPGISRLPNNKGLEAMVVVPSGLPLAGTLIALSERGLDPHGNLRAFLIGGPSAGEFSIRRSDDFDISDCALMPSGDLLILERRFAWWSGIAMRIRRIPLAAIAPGALVDGRELVFADMGYQIDNMEGLSVHRTPAGELILTLVSDDNFSALQRTILLQFKMVEE
ncbi:MAG TPA: esterase-like activity of phytase family protein [Caldimonas sp.]|nr:esterase-like activity of phytase family protein [Caldimonas sp.]